MKKVLLFVFPLLALVTGCQPMSSPSSRKVVTVDTIFTQARCAAHGAYYPGLDNKVFALDLYGGEITLSGDTLFGTGTQLHFSDVFLSALSDSLEEGSYRVDSTGKVFTALSGMNFEGDITGTYLLLWQQSALSSIYLFPDGTFSLRQEGDTAVMEFHLKTADAKTYDATYRGVIQYLP